MFFFFFPYSSSICSNSSDDKQEIEGNEEFKSKGLTGTNGRNCDTTRHERVKNAFKSEGGTYGSRDLGGDVGRDMGPSEVAEGGQSDGERRVQVGTRDVSY